MFSYLFKINNFVPLPNSYFVIKFGFMAGYPP